MTLEELKERLQKNNIPDRWYSLDEGLKSDSLIISNNYSIWECFYYSERGDRLDYISISEEEIAYEWLWDKIQHQMKFIKIPPKSN